MPLLDNLLQGLPEDVKNNVQRVVINYKLDPDNPEVLLAVLCGHIESITRAIPARIAEETQKAASLAGAMAEKNIQLREREIQRRLVQSVIENSETVLKARTRANRLRWLCAACVLTVTLAASCLYGGYHWGYGIRDADYRLELARLPKVNAFIAERINNDEDLKRLSWALSDGGRQAKRLPDLNGGVKKILRLFRNRKH